MLIFPWVEGAENQVAPSNNAIGLNETLKHEMFGGAEIHGILENTLYFLTPENQRFSRISSDVLKVKADGVLNTINVQPKKYKYVKVKVKVKVKVRYKYKGKWRIKYVYKYKYVYKRIAVPVKTAVKSTSKSSNTQNSNPTSSSAITTSGKCSCSLYTDYNVHTGTWLNYCPYCHKYSTLVYDKPAECPEGMIRCTCCDADFCIVHGKEHINTNPKFLTKA